MIFIARIERISLMADAAGAITNGFNESSILIIIKGICRLHCKKAVDTQVLRIRNEEKRSNIIQGIITLQLCHTKDI